MGTFLAQPLAHGCDHPKAPGTGHVPDALSRVPAREDKVNKVGPTMT